MREMAPPGKGCVVWTFGLVSAPSYPRHLSRSQPRSLATHVTVELTRADCGWARQLRIWLNWRGWRRLGVRSAASSCTMSRLPCPAQDLSCLPPPPHADCACSPRDLVAFSLISPLYLFLLSPVLQAGLSDGAALWSSGRRPKAPSWGAAVQGLGFRV